MARAGAKAEAGAGAAAGGAGEDAAGASHVPLVRRLLDASNRIETVPICLRCAHSHTYTHASLHEHTPQSRFKTIAQQDREMGGLNHDTLERICKPALLSIPGPHRL